MKIYLICALVCLAGVAQGATIQRIARDTGAIIPTIVEEILKVELTSDLKKNSAVEVLESEPLVKEEILEPVKAETVVEPIASRTVEDGALPVEEKKPAPVEILAAQEILPEPIAAVLKTETLPEIKEKVEILAVPEILAEKPIDSFRTESVPSAELPLLETVKETLIIEPVLELKKEPEAAIILKEEEIVRPMTRNVVKEEIPQVEELRNVLPEDTSAVKEVVPEPIASSNIVEPVVEVEQVVKTVAAEPVKEIKEETPLAPELKAELPLTKVEVLEPLKENKLELPLAALLPEIKDEKLLTETKATPEIKEIIITEIKATPELKPEIIITELKATPIKEGIVISEVKSSIESKPFVETVAAPEAKPTLEGAAPIVDEKDLEIRQDRPTLVQTVQDAIANVPIVGQIFNRNPAVATASDESIADESATSTQRPFVQQVIQNTQQAFQNALNALNPASSNAGEGTEGAGRPPNPLQGVVQFAQNAIQNAVQSATNLVNNRPGAATTGAPATQSDEKPVKVDEKEKFNEPEPQIAVQKEVAEPQTVVVEEEKENVVKN